MRSSWWEFVRFAIVGCLNVLVSSLIFYVAYKHLQLGQFLFEHTGSAGRFLKDALAGHGVGSLDGAIASIVGYLGGMVNSFLLNRTWTFRVEERSARQLWRFVVLNLAGLVVGTASIFLFVDTMGGPYLAIWLVTITFTTMLNYLGNKFWTFARH